MNGFYWIYFLMLGLTLRYHFSKNVEQKRLLYWGAVGFLLLLLGGAAFAFVCGVFCKPIMSFILTYVYEYHTMYQIADGGETLLVVLWIVMLLSYWLLKDRMEDGNIKLSFMMILAAAALQPVCFAFYNWLRAVLFFRIALVPMCAQLYVALFCKRENNRALVLLNRCTPKVRTALLSAYDKKISSADADCAICGAVSVVHQRAGWCRVHDGSTWLNDNTKEITNDCSTDFCLLSI